MLTRGLVCGNGCDYSKMGGSYSLNSSSDVRLVAPSFGGFGLPQGYGLGYGADIHACATNGHYSVGAAYPCFNPNKNQCNREPGCGYGGQMATCNCGRQ